MNIAVTLKNSPFVGELAESFRFLGHSVFYFVFNNIMPASDMWIYSSDDDEYPDFSQFSGKVIIWLHKKNSSTVPQGDNLVFVSHEQQTVDALFIEPPFSAVENPSVWRRVSRQFLDKGIICPLLARSQDDFDFEQKIDETISYTRPRPQGHILEVPSSFLNWLTVSDPNLLSASNGVSEDEFRSLEESAGPFESAVLLGINPPDGEVVARVLKNRVKHVMIVHNDVRHLFFVYKQLAEIDLLDNTKFLLGHPQNIDTAERACREQKYLTDLLLINTMQHSSQECMNLIAIYQRMVKRDGVISIYATNRNSETQKVLRVLEGCCAVTRIASVEGSGIAYFRKGEFDATYRNRIGR